MKFHQTIVPVILSVIYTTTIFGAEETTLTNVREKLYIPKVICDMANYEIIMWHRFPVWSVFCKNVPASDKNKRGPPQGRVKP